MNKTVPILALVLALAGCDEGTAKPEATVENPIITLPAVPGRPGAAYFTLRTNNDPTRLAGITSPRIGRIELHETATIGGISRMIPLRDATFDPERPLTFAPGSGHAMLFDLDPGLKVGDRVKLDFTFEPAAAVTVEAEVRAPGDVAHGGH